MYAEESLEQRRDR